MTETLSTIYSHIKTGAIESCTAINPDAKRAARKSAVNYITDVFFKEAAFSTNQERDEQNFFNCLQVIKETGFEQIFALAHQAKCLLQPDHTPRWLHDWCSSYQEKIKLLSKAFTFDQLKTWRWIEIPVLTYIASSQKTETIYFVAGLDPDFQGEMLYLPPWLPLDDLATDQLKTVFNTVFGQASKNCLIWPLYPHDAGTIKGNSLGLPLAIGLDLLIKDLSWPTGLYATGGVDGNGKLLKVGSIAAKKRETKGCSYFLFPRDSHDEDPAFLKDKIIDCCSLAEVYSVTDAITGGSSTDREDAHTLKSWLRLQQSPFYFPDHILFAQEQAMGTVILADEIERIMDALKKSKHRRLLLTGLPGSGKSVLLAQICQKYHESVIYLTYDGTIPAISANKTVGNCDLYNTGMNQQSQCSKPSSAVAIYMHYLISLCSLMAVKLPEQALPVSNAQVQIQQLLALAAEQGKGVLVVIDALNKALFPAESIRPWPNPLPQNLSILASSQPNSEIVRHIGGDIWDVLDIKQITAGDDFEELKNIKDETLPYYKDRNSDVFFDTHLSVLKEKWGDDLYEKLFARLLREKSENKEYVFPAINLLENDQELSVNSRISSLDESTLQVSDAFLDAIKTVTPNIIDNTTFAIDKLDLNNNTITCCLSSYYKALYSCDRFQYQMITSYPGNSGDLKRYKNSSFLDEWSNQLKEIVLNNNYSTIEASIGCSCLFVYKTNTGYEFFLGCKSPDANGLRDIHVFPSFMFQPIGKNKLKYHKETSIIYQVLRELTEEIFGHDEYEADTLSRYIQEKILTTPQNQHIMEMLANGKAEFCVTGLWLDMYRLRPEITTTLIIHDPDWFTSFFPLDIKIGNWEVEDGGLLDMDLDMSSYNSIVKGEAGFMCSPGIAALVSGVKRIKTLVDMP